jgi:hypothetical protein
MLLGTGRGEFQLPPALPGYALGMIFGQKGRLWYHALDDEFEAVAVSTDAAGVEMPADHQGRGIGETRK